MQNTPKLSLQEEIIVNALFENPGLSETRLSKKLDIPRREVTMILKRPVIQNYLDMKRKELAEKSMISVKRVLEEEECIAFYDIADMYDKEGVILPVQKMPERIKRAMSVRIRDGKEELFLLVTDKGRALERIGKHLGMYEADNTQKQGRIIFIRHDEAKDYIDITPVEETKPDDSVKALPARAVCITD